MQKSELGPRTSKIEPEPLTSSILKSKSSSANSCLSITSISLRSKCAAYFCQCLFIGDESFKYFAATIRVARKTRCLVEGEPVERGGKRYLSLSRYTSVHNRVGTWHFDFLTIVLMKWSSEGNASALGSWLGVIGGVSISVTGSGLHRITWTALSAMCATDQA